MSEKLIIVNHTIKPDAKLPVGRSYDEWIADLAKMMKQYPLLQNRWRTSKFKKLHKEGWTVRSAFRIWFLSHS